MRSRPPAPGPFGLAVFLAASLFIGQTARATGAQAQADPSYADPILFPEQRYNNWLEFQMTPVIDADAEKMIGLQIHLHTSDKTVLTLGLGRRTQEWRSAYVAGGTFYKTYSLQLRSGWGDPDHGVGHGITLTGGLDWTIDDDELAGCGMLGYSLETRFAGFGLEFHLAGAGYVFDMFSDTGGGWEDIAIALILAMKASYEVFSGGHALVELRMPFFVLQPETYSEFAPSEGWLGDAVNMDLAFGWRQNWGPLTGGLSFILHLLGNGPDTSAAREEIKYMRRAREDFAIMLDIGWVFY
jgi:hypothetical protein